MSGSWRGSLRLQLTLAFSLVFLIGGLAVLAGTTIMVRNATAYMLDIAFSSPPQVDPAPDYGDWMTRLIILESMQRNLVTKLGLTVLLVWLSATVAGWFVAGRLLRPLRTITATAQRIAGRTLHRRIALDAPPGEVKMLADSFDRMLDRIDEAFAGQSRFIANAAHELKTPLAVNRTLIEVAMKGPDVPPQMRILGDNLLAVNQRHERLIDALLTLARADQAGAERHGLDLADLAAAAIEATRPLAEEHGVRIEAELAPATAYGDPILLEQAIRNLVDNGVRYNHPGGSVRVQTRGTAQRVEVVVTNTGPAIPPYRIPSLFEPFRRLNDRVGSGEGSGLGMSIVRAVAQSHQGYATATPRPGGGLEVRLALPRGAMAAGWYAASA
ncbi:MAG: HAMP domain-containing protein [Dactylosporangium sp.]|nr:HAMP domain-containing protein [Dactylosporangium sp.]